MSWLDGPFFTIVEQILGTVDYFLDITQMIGKIAFVIAIGITSMKMAFGGVRIGEEAIKKLLTFIMLFLIINNYNDIREGIQDLAYEIPYNALYTNEITGRLTRLAHDDDTVEILERYSDIIQEIQYHVGSQVMSYYVLDLFDENYHFLRPNAIARLQLLTLEATYKGLKSTGFHVGQQLILGIQYVAQVICSVLMIAVYLVSVIEFLLIFTVGVPFLGTMMWDGSKFVAEKWIGAVLAQTVKLIFITFVWMLVFSGLIDQVSNYNFSGNSSVDELFGTIFMSVFYLVLILAAPQLATALMSGMPQLGFTDIAAGVAAAGTAISAARTGGHRLAKTGLAGLGHASYTAGSIAKGASSGSQIGSKFGTVGKMLGGLAGSIAGAGEGIGKSIGNAAKGAGHETFKKIASPVQGVTIPGFGRVGGENTSPSRYSQASNMNEKYSGYDGGGRSPGRFNGVQGSGSAPYDGRGNNSGIKQDSATFGEYMRGNYRAGRGEVKTPNSMNIPKADIKRPSGPTKTPPVNPIPPGLNAPQQTGNITPSQTGMPVSHKNTRGSELRALPPSALPPGGKGPVGVTEDAGMRTVSENVTKSRRNPTLIKEQKHKAEDAKIIKG